MAHRQQMEFCESVKRELPQYFSDRFVVDIGSLDINGNNQYLFNNCLYLGVDLMPGKNVDIACKGHELGLPNHSVDVVISTECFEHDQFYQLTLKNIVRMLKPGGLFLFSCATTGRPEHGTRRTKPEDAPFTQEFGEWGDYYKNLAEDDIREVLDIDEIFDRYAFSYNWETCDLYFWGLKKGQLDFRENYSFHVRQKTMQTEQSELARALAEKEAEVVGLAAKAELTERSIEELRSSLGGYRKRTEELDRIVTALRGSVVDYQKRIDELKSDLARSVGEAENMSAALREREQQIANAWQAVAERDTIISNLYQSRSWRITAPFRAVSNAVRAAAPRREAAERDERFVSQHTYARLRAIARVVYHRIPLPQSVKWKIRERLSPAVVALRESGDLKGVTEGVVKAILGVSDNAPSREGAREVALDRILVTLGDHALRFGPTTHWIALPFLATGGAEMVALNYCRALRQLRPEQSVVLLITDRDQVSERMLVPDGVAVVVLDRFLPSSTSYTCKQALLRDLLLAAQPECFHNINSEVAWHLIVSEGERLKRYVKLFASIFAFQFAPDGRTKIGYAAYFLEKGIPHLSGLLSDNRRFLDDAIYEYRIQGHQASLLKALYQPCRLLVDAEMEDVGRQYIERRQASLVDQRHGVARRPQILWAGRLDAEKRIDLFIEIVRRCDFADFRVFGQIVLEEEASLPELPNLTYEGPFTSPTEWTEHFDFDAFIFTSKWEGMPNILIEVGALGIPIIAPLVGGVGELVTEETGYPLPERPSIDDYISALRDATSNPSEALNRALRLHEIVVRRHSWAAFVDALEQLTAYVKSSEISQPTDHSSGEGPDISDVGIPQTRSELGEPVVSVVIPCYNQAQYLMESVTSALTACNHPIEVIVVDDGSTDARTGRLLAEAERIAPGIVRIHRQENQGLSGARNTGISLAKGRFIQFLDADDVLVPGKMDVQLAQFSINPNIDVSICNFLLCDEARNEYSKPEEAIAHSDLSLQDFLYRWERGFAVPIHCGLFRRDAIDNRRFDTEIRAKEDWVFWTSLALSGVRFAYVHGHWAIYRQHNSSMRRSYLNMGRSWLRAGMKIESMLKDREPRFFEETVSWFDQCYRSSPEYRREIQTLDQNSGTGMGDGLCQTHELNHTGADGSSTKHIDVDRIIARLEPVLGTDADPLISVVVPVYCHYEYLEGCISSVALQGNVALELICVDDASPDARVRQFMDALSNRLPGLRIVRQERNVGISEVQNIAVREARGEFIAFLDCDDELMPGALQEVAKHAAAHPEIDYFFTDRIDISEEGRVIRTARYGGYDSIQFKSQDGIRGDLLDGMVASHLKVIRREAYLSVDGCNPLFSGVQDWDLALKIAERYKLRYIDQPLYRHRVHGGSVTRNDLVAQFRKTNVLRRDFGLRWLCPQGAQATLDSKPIVISGAALPVPLEDLKSSWRAGRRCAIDLRGPLQIASVNFVREFNSYFDEIWWDDPRTPAALFGYLWNPSMLHCKQSLEDLQGVVS